MSRRAEVLRRSRGTSSLTAEDLAFLDFVARLAVERALREANASPPAATCNGEQAGGKSRNDDDHT